MFAGVLTEFGGQQLARDHTSIVPLLVDVTRYVSAHNIRYEASTSISLLSRFHRRVLDIIQ